MPMLRRRHPTWAEACALRAAPAHDTGSAPGVVSPAGFVDAPGPGRSPAETSWRWCRAGRRMDLEAARGLLAPDVVLHMPITDAFQFEGAEEVLALLARIFATVDFLDFHTDVGEGSTRVVGLHSRVDGIRFEEFQVLTFDQNHRIVEAILVIRPAIGAAAILASLGPQLLGANHARWSYRPSRGFLLAAARVLGVLETHVFPLAQPRRAPR